MFKLLTIAALMTICGQVNAETIGVHTFSLHAKETFTRSYTEGGSAQIPFNNINPGLYYIADNGFTVGGYYNSYRHKTAYVGWTWETRSYGPFKLAATAAVATGYSRLPGVGMLRPMVMPSIVIAGSDGYSVKWSVAPGKSGVFQHMSIERKF